MCCSARAWARTIDTAPLLGVCWREDAPAPQACRRTSSSSECVLAGGDDYELAFTAPAAERDAVAAAAAAAGTPVTRIGAHRSRAWAAAVRCERPRRADARAGLRPFRLTPQRPVGAPRRLRCTAAMWRLLALACLLLSLLAPAPAAASRSYRATVTSVVDGDTLWVRRAAGGARHRDPPAGHRRAGDLPALGRAVARRPAQAAAVAQGGRATSGPATPTAACSRACESATATSAAGWSSTGWPGRRVSSSGPGPMPISRPRLAPPSAGSGPSRGPWSRARSGASTGLAGTRWRSRRYHRLHAHADARPPAAVRPRGRLVRPGPHAAARQA